MKIYKLIFILGIFPYFAYSQEIITDLSVNFHKKEHVKAIKYNEKSEKSVWNFLPFVDDFSMIDIYPNQDLWADKYAFINNSYPKNPITIGVATFDALNDSGAIYSHANPQSFIADHLTSNLLRLDSIYSGSNLVPVKTSDSLYLSFYYQPQGIGNAPEAHDSLVLEFYSPTDSMWYNVWSTYGQSYQSFINTYQTDFRLIMVPITDSVKFFHKDFQFRFVNYASIGNNYEPSWAGNVDQWHLDYVCLNIGRNINDTVFEDVAFTGSMGSLFVKYQSVPWKHYLLNPSL
ncbi:MAG: hypothetical protein PHT69_13635, partial [Bacteroidales bacterium]|nr:hypothetical protein [Bacteroidales bacterium]